MPAMKTDYRSLYDKDFIGAWDLTDGDKVITITKVVGGQLTGQGGRKSRKPVIYFSGSDKGFALNSTNGKQIAALYGNFTEGWVGKRIAIYKSVTRNPQGEGDVDCIRVRPSVPGAFSEDDEPVLISDEQVRELLLSMEQRGIDKKAFLERAGIESVDKLPASKLKGARKWIDEQTKTNAE